MEKLAIFGGTPIREKMLYYGGQWIDNDDINAVVNALKDRAITCGPKVEELERRLADFVESKYAVVCSNGTAALHCACLAAGIKPGDEVITTPLTFAASANCILYCGGTPVFADINPKTYNIDPISIKEKITSKTKAVIAVDYTGQAVEIDEIKKLCEEHNLVFIEDAAHSIGTKYNGRRVGGLADMTCFSFHPVKTITAGEGGAITTNNYDLYRKLVLYHTHGITHNSSEMRNMTDEPWYYEQIELGYNYRMTDFQSALLMSQLNKIESFIQRRKQIVNIYNNAFKDVPEIILQEEIDKSDTCRHLYVIRLMLNRLNCTRKEFFLAMEAENVRPQVHYIPTYWFPYYEKNGYKKGLCPKAEEIYEGILSIPLYPKMSDDDVQDVISAINKVINFYKK